MVTHSFVGCCGAYQGIGEARETFPAVLKQSSVGSALQGLMTWAARCCVSCRAVEKYGEGQWSLISTLFPGRIGKQGRERGHHQLTPKIKRNAWSMEEERIIVAAHKVSNNSVCCHAQTLQLLWHCNSPRQTRTKLVTQY